MTDTVETALKLYYPSLLTMRMWLLMKSTMMQREREVEELKAEKVIKRRERKKKR